MEHGIHDGPLRSGCGPATFDFFSRQLDYGRASDVRLEPVRFDENPAPDNLPRFAGAFQCSTAQREIHRRLSFTDRTFIAANEMSRRSSPGDFQDPYKFAVVLLSETNVVQRGLWLKFQFRPYSIGDQRIHAGTLIDFIKMGKGCIWIKDAITAALTYWRPIDIVQQAFD